MSAFFSKSTFPVSIFIKMAARAPLAASATLGAARRAMHSAQKNRLNAVMRTSALPVIRGSLKRNLPVLLYMCAKLSIVPVSAVAFFDSLNGKGQQYRASNKAYGAKAGHAAKNGDYQYKERGLDALLQK